MSPHGPVPPAPGSRAGSVSEVLERNFAEMPPKDGVGAAVLIVLREGLSDVETLLIERTERKEDRASGQVALPGGHVDETDRDLRAAAIRELAEEVGLTDGDLRGPPQYVRTELASVFSLRVAVFAAELAPAAPPPRVGSPEEVAHVFWLPTRSLDVTQRVQRVTRNGTIEVDATVFSGHVLWGFTRRVLLDFFQPPSSA